MDEFEGGHDAGYALPHLPNGGAKVEADMHDHLGKKPLLIYPSQHRRKTEIIAVMMALNIYMAAHMELRIIWSSTTGKAGPILDPTSVGSSGCDMGSEMGPRPSIVQDVPPRLGNALLCDGVRVTVVMTLAKVGVSCGLSQFTVLFPP
jgi:hypothetical protein